MRDEKLLYIVSENMYQNAEDLIKKQFCKNSKKKKKLNCENH